MKKKDPDRELTFNEQDTEEKPTGRYAKVSGVTFSPLQYSDLVGKNLSKNWEASMNWKGEKVIESNFPDLAGDDPVSGSFAIEFDQTSRTIALVKGGWLPVGLAVDAGFIILPDRCVFTEIKRRFAGGLKTNEEDRDFIDFLPSTTAVINPLLFVLEGNRRRNPTNEDIVSQFQEAISILKKALPDAVIHPTDTVGREAVLSIINDTKEGMEAKKMFLAKLAPKLCTPTKLSRRELLWDLILSTAKDCGVGARSLVVIAALSAATVPNGRSPAKRLLKLKVPYTEEDAYNALADLRALELLMHLFAQFPDEKMTICTADKDLALFWSGIRAREFKIVDGKLTFVVAPVEGLLPGITERSRIRLLDLP
jgi:hypothetical protein